MNTQSSRFPLMGSFAGVILGFATFSTMAAPRIASQLSSSASVSNVGEGGHTVLKSHRTDATRFFAALRKILCQGRAAWRLKTPFRRA